MGSPILWKETSSREVEYLLYETFSPISNGEDITYSHLKESLQIVAQFGGEIIPVF